MDKDAIAPMSMILLAVELDDVSLLDQLVSEGHPADGLPNYFGMSTLAFATYQQAEGSFYWALKQKVDPNLAGLGGDTALMSAATYSQERLASITGLIEAGADSNAVNSEGWSALAIAVSTQEFDNALLLIEFGADFNSTKNFLVERTRTFPSSDARTEARATINVFEDILQRQESE